MSLYTIEVKTSDNKMFNATMRASSAKDAFERFLKSRKWFMGCNEHYHITACDADTYGSNNLTIKNIDYTAFVDLIKDKK